MITFISNIFLYWNILCIKLNIRSIQITTFQHDEFIFCKYYEVTSAVSQSLFATHIHSGIVVFQACYIEVILGYQFYLFIVNGRKRDLAASLAFKQKSHIIRFRNDKRRAIESRPLSA